MVHRPFASAMLPVSIQSAKNCLVSLPSGLLLPISVWVVPGVALLQSSCRRASPSGCQAAWTCAKLPHAHRSG